MNMYTTDMPAAISYSPWHEYNTPKEHKEMLPILVNHKFVNDAQQPTENGIWLNTKIISVINSHTIVGFSGSTKLDTESTNLAWAIAEHVTSTYLPTRRGMVTGCARGLDAIVRTAVSSFGWGINHREKFDYAEIGCLNVFDVKNYTSKEGEINRGSFARRSIDCVQSVERFQGSKLWIAFPTKSCPEELMEKPIENPFQGYGSGTWATISLAAFKGITCLIHCPLGYQMPNWKLKSLGDRWFLFTPEIGALTKTSVKTIYTIGHSNNGIHEFVSLLKQNGITVVCDVRSIPYCKHSPQFNIDSLKKSLKECGIKYLNLGKELGGKPAAPKDVFDKGISRLKDGLSLGYQIALMCAEKTPTHCHRTLICHRLQEGENPPIIRHI